MTVDPYRHRDEMAAKTSSIEDRRRQFFDIVELNDFIRQVYSSHQDLVIALLIGLVSVGLVAQSCINTVMTSCCFSLLFNGS